MSLSSLVPIHSLSALSSLGLHATLYRGMALVVPLFLLFLVVSPHFHQASALLQARRLLHHRLLSPVLSKDASDVSIGELLQGVGPWRDRFVRLFEQIPLETLVTIEKSPDAPYVVVEAALPQGNLVIQVDAPLNQVRFHFSEQLCYSVSPQSLSGPLTLEALIGQSSKTLVSFPNRNFSPPTPRSSQTSTCTQLAPPPHPQFPALLSRLGDSPSVLYLVASLFLSSLLPLASADEGPERNAASDASLFVVLAILSLFSIAAVYKALHLLCGMPTESEPPSHEAILDYVSDPERGPLIDARFLP